MIELELPDGTVLEFPDNTPRDVMQNAGKKILAQKKVVPIPEPVSGPTTTGAKPLPRELNDLIPKGTFTGAGGMIGGMAGLAGGPAALGTSIAGGALGAAGASALFDNVDNFLKSQGFFDKAARGPTAQKDVVDISKRAVAEGTIDTAFGMGGAVIGPIFNILRGGKPVIARILGVANEEAAKVAQEGLRQGIGIGVQDVSKRKFVSGIGKVAGVFPFIGTPFRQAAERAGPEIEQAFARDVARLAPTGMMGDLGVDTAALAKGQFKAVRGTADLLYGRFRALAASADVHDIVPTNAIKNATEETLETFSKKVTATEAGATGPKLTGPMNRFMTKVQSLPDRISVEQAQGLSEELSDIMSTAQRVGNNRTISAGTSLKKAGLELDLQNLDITRLPEGQGETIVKALEEANSFLSKNLPKFETATAKKFLRSDKAAFQGGVFKSGSQEADRLGQVLLTNPTPLEVQNIRKVIGQDALNKLTAKKLEIGFEEASRSGLFDADVFARELGLTGGRRQLQGEALNEMLKNSPLGIEDITDFVDTARLASQRNAQEASSFLARRLVLGGSIGGAMTGGFLAGGSTIGIPTAALVSLGARAVNKRLTDPKFLLKATQALNDTLPQKVKRAALLRIMSVSGFDAGLRNDLMEATGITNGSQ